MVERLMQGSSKETKKKPFKLPTSSALSQVKSFLPKLKSANDKLTEDDKQDIGIENVPETCESYVQMDVALFPDSDEDSDTEDDTRLTCKLKLHSDVSKIVELN